MNGEDLFRGLNFVNVKFIDEAETVTHLKDEKKPNWKQKKSAEQ